MHVIAVEAHTIFQALADPVRVRIVRLLGGDATECCLCELVDSLAEPQYALSKHVKVLKQAGLLNAQKDGRWVYLSLVRDEDVLEPLYSAILAAPDNNGMFSADLTRFKKRMRLREDGRCRIGIQTPQLKAC